MSMPALALAVRLNPLIAYAVIVPPEDVTMLRIIDGIKAVLLVLQINWFR